MPDWGELFALSRPPLEILVRGTVTFLALLALLRLTGQREAGGLGITDVLLIVLVADAAGGGLVGESHSVADGIALVATILFWSVALDALVYRWPRLAVLLKARPRLLIVDGRLNRAVMRREFMTYDEVLSQLRLHGIEDVTRVRRAYLEPNGMISVLRGDDAEVDEPVESPVRT
ncbi:DUF421 domain-containing protein [Micromonospora echinaurantiaca]|uniref:DUF421 domain-containing protein n=1 Tax=Micromonospora echinaurantiaca TaxID=47857 RepID=UPI00371EA833